MKRIVIIMLLTCVVLFSAGCGKSVSSDSTNVQPETTNVQLEITKVIQADVGRLHGAKAEKTLKVNYVNFEEVAEGRYQVRVELIYDIGDYSYSQLADFFILKYGDEYNISDSGGTYFQQNEIE